MPSASTKLDYSDLPAILWLQNAESHLKVLSEFMEEQQAQAAAPQEEQ